MDTARSDGDRLLLPREAAAALCVTIKTLRRWHAEGRVTAQRTAGRHRRYKASEIRDIAAGDAA